MLKMSLARVSSYTYEVSGIWESILIPAVARARFVQRARTRLHSRTHVRAYTYTDREQERAGYRSWRDEATTSGRLVLDVLTPRELTPSVSS